MEHFACLADNLLVFRGFQNGDSCFFAALIVEVREHGLNSRFGVAVFCHLGDGAEDDLLGGEINVPYLRSYGWLRLRRVLCAPDGWPSCLLGISGGRRLLLYGV